MLKGKVLFIDDDNFLRKVYQAELQEKGLEVFLAADGDDGLRKIVEINPDVVILDLIMPKKNGFEVLSELQRYDDVRFPPVIVLSNLAQSEDQKRALDLGAVDYLVKDNTTLDIITEKINYYMGLSRKNKRIGDRAAASGKLLENLSLKAKTTEDKGVETKRREETKKFSVQLSSGAGGRGRNFCPACGYKLKKSEQFCPDCGMKIN